MWKRSFKPDMITTRFAERQAALERRRHSAAQSYPSLWQRMLADWQRPDETPRAWLLYSANYLFHTAGVRWALDPLSLSQRVPNAPEADASALAALDMIVLTHRHADHLDLDLLRRMRDFPARWIISEFLLDSLQGLDLPVDRLIIPKPLQPICCGRLKLTPFDGLHWADDPAVPDGKTGVPATGYLVEFDGRRWLFPGDTRTYSASLLPDFGPLDGLFVHLWLGRGCALMDEPPLIQSFCQFCLDLRPRRIVISHLEELGREVDDYWDETQARKVMLRLQETAVGMDVAAATMGAMILL
jgi:hypothetical protein